MGVDGMLPFIENQGGKICGEEQDGDVADEYAGNAVGGDVVKHDYQGECPACQRDEAYEIEGVGRQLHVVAVDNVKVGD